MWDTQKYIIKPKTEKGKNKCRFDFDKKKTWIFLNVFHVRSAVLKTTAKTKVVNLFKIHFHVHLIVMLWLKKTNMISIFVYPIY